MNRQKLGINDESCAWRNCIVLVESKNVLEQYHPKVTTVTITIHNKIVASNQFSSRSFSLFPSKNGLFSELILKNPPDVSLPEFKIQTYN